MKITKKSITFINIIMQTIFTAPKYKSLDRLLLLLKKKSYTKNIKNIELKLNKINNIVTVTDANQNKNDCRSCNCDYSIDLSHLRSNYLKQVVLK